MDIEKEIKNIKHSIREIEEDLTNLKQQLSLNKLLGQYDLLTDTEKADLMNGRKYQCNTCYKAKYPEEFEAYNEEEKKGICKDCYNSIFHNGEMDF